MVDIMPLNEEQLKLLPQNISSMNKPARILCDGKAVNITTGVLVGGNVMYHPVYWDRPDEFFETAIDFLCQNNPGKKFRVVR